MSKQSVTPPIRIETPDEVMSDYVETHPSYGVLNINRSPGGGHTLFGSSIEHHETICLTISHAEKHRDLNSDYFHETKEIIEVWMSPTQFADVITSFGQGSGTPVTIRHIQGKRFPLPEYRDIKQEFRSEFAQKAQEISTDLAQAVHDLKELMLKPTIPKTKLKEVLSKLEGASMGISNNMPFVLDQFHEQMVNTVTEAKGEVEAFIARKIMEKGLTAITQGTIPVNLLDDGKKAVSHLCTICHEVPVDVANGFDTCPNCLKTKV